MRHIMPTKRSFVRLLKEIYMAINARENDTIVTEVINKEFGIFTKNITAAEHPKIMKNLQIY